MIFEYIWMTANQSEWMCASCGESSSDWMMVGISLDECRPRLLTVENLGGALDGLEIFMTP